MALSLTAEQKSLMTLFTTRDKYIIPSYQRPYSWEYEQCLTLYSDVIEAYNAGNDYFLGNIIISRSRRDANRPQIVDGQQRILTLWIVFKALSVILPEIEVLKEVTKVRSWDGNSTEVKVYSDIFESEDEKYIEAVAKYSAQDFNNKLSEASNSKGDISPNKFSSNIITNSLYFYRWFSDYVRKEGKEAVVKFLQYFLEEVSLLPIELNGEDQKEADDKALTIFETINNRGKDLEDADIFKAKLYGKATTRDEQEEFINLWIEFKAACKMQNMDIDDAFRFYSHVVRGEKGITGPEKSLRDFFVNDNNSPLIHKGYREVMHDLMSVLEALHDINVASKDRSELAAWIQLVYAYSNVYPLYALMAYAYKNGVTKDIPLTIEFLKSIIRYCYYQGATTIVKFEIYNIIRQVFHDQPVKEYYQKYIDSSYFANLGRLKYGYALLVQYLQETKAIQSYTIDKLLTSRDVSTLDSSWDGHNLYDHTDDLGNFVVLDCGKKNRRYFEKRYVYMTSKVPGVRSFLSSHDFVSFDELQKRTRTLITILRIFFLEPKEDGEN